jgi:hypothetical protein
MIDHAQPTQSSAAASNHGAASPSLELLEARRLRDALKLLLRREQSALAQFLVALADFDSRRGWEPLGHASLFAFITSELGLSPAPTYWRQEAARLLKRFPDLVEPLRQGKLCLTTMAELAKVLTAENKEAVLPRFLGISSRDAKEIVAELQPRLSPPMRTVITPLAPVRRAEPILSLLATPSSAALATSATSVAQAGLSPHGAVQHTDPGSLWAPKTPVAYAAHSAHPAWVEPRRDEVDPLTAELSRLSTTVSRRFLQKLKAARAGLAHARPGATTEQVLEAALDLLLEKQARSRGQVRRPRAVVGKQRVVAGKPRAEVERPPAPTEVEALARPAKEGPATLHAASTSDPESIFPTAAPLHRRDQPREPIPAAVRRAVWARDAGRCSWPLDGGGCCGSTHRLELDHVVPWARWGDSTEANLRLTYAAHNRLAAREAFGKLMVRRYAKAASGG